MNLLSRRSVLAIAAVVDVALHSRSAPVAAKSLAGRHRLPPRHLETVLQGLVRAEILEGLRGPRGGYKLTRERRRITVGEMVRTAMSLSTVEPQDLGANSILLQRVINPAVRKAGETFLTISIRSPSSSCARRPKKPMCSTTRRRPESSFPDQPCASLAPTARAIWIASRALTTLLSPVQTGLSWLRNPENRLEFRKPLRQPCGE